MHSFFSWIETLAIANAMSNDQLIVALNKLVSLADTASDTNVRVTLCHTADLVALILNVRDYTSNQG